MKKHLKTTAGRIIELLMKKWNVGARDLAGILTAFSCTGTSILFIREPLFQLTGLSEQPLWIIVPAYPFVMVPVFYILLLFFGTVTGQRAFFWNRVKRLAAVAVRSRED